MGRNRIPTAVQELKGAFRKNPQRKRSEPKSAGPLGDPPADLNDVESALWLELAGMAPWLDRSDRWLVKKTVRLKAKDDNEGDPDCKTCEGRRFLGTEKPVYCPVCNGLSNTQLTQFIACFKLLGITPVDRSKVTAPADREEDNRFADFADENGARPN